MTHPQTLHQTRQQSLQGQVALVTGASQGIGWAVAEQLAAHGLHMALCARNTDKLTQLAAHLADRHPAVQTLVLPCDVRDANQVGQVVEQTAQRFGRLDVLINNAGVAPKVGLMQEMSIDDIDRTIDTNLKGAAYAMRAVLPVMIQQQRGTIVNINSIAGKTAYPYWAIYDASKFGLHALTAAVADEQRSNNIRVVGIYPGAVRTEIWGGLELEHPPDDAGMLDVSTVAQAVLYVLSQPDTVHVQDITLAPLKPAL